MMAALELLLVIVLGAIVVTVNAQSVNEIRLTNGSSLMDGRLEIYENNTWWAICERNVTFEPEMFTTDVVACRQLGFGDAASRTKSFPSGTVGNVTFVSCKGYENRVQDCQLVGTDADCSAYVGIACTSLETNYTRLAGGSSNLEGRVEVYFDGLWGTACIDGWGMNEAMVVCRQLGYGTPTDDLVIGVFGPGTGDIMFRNLNCAGTEANLFECPVSPYISFCVHEFDVGIICSFPDDYDIRLNGGTSSLLDGRVEVFWGGFWGTVCNDGWDIVDAAVACLQLNLGMAAEIIYVSGGKGDVFFSRMQCVGTENKLEECEHEELIKFYCNSHKYDSGVVCAEGTEYTMRLTGGLTYLDGQVEVIVDDEWRTVCFDGWDIVDAQVVCRQLGSQTALQTSYVYDTDLVGLRNVFCSGSEAGLHRCPRLPGGDCSGLRLARVECEGSQYVEEGTLRLEGGSSSNKGRVEIMYQNEWSLICDQGWDINDAKVACTELGFDYASDGFVETTSENGNFVLYNVDCRGTPDETRLIYCRHGPWGNRTCSQGYSAKVICKYNKLTTGEIVGISFGCLLGVCVFLYVVYHGLTRNKDGSSMPAADGAPPVLISIHTRTDDSGRDTPELQHHTLESPSVFDGHPTTELEEYTPEAPPSPGVLDDLPPPYDVVVRESPYKEASAQARPPSYLAL